MGGGHCEQSTHRIGVSHLAVVDRLAVTSEYLVVVRVVGRQAVGVWNEQTIGSDRVGGGCHPPTLGSTKAGLRFSK